MCCGLQNVTSSCRVAARRMALDLAPSADGAVKTLGGVPPSHARADDTRGSEETATSLPGTTPAVSDLDAAVQQLMMQPTSSAHRQLSQEVGACAVGELMICRSWASSASFSATPAAAGVWVRAMCMGAKRPSSANVRRSCSRNVSACCYRRLALPWCA